MSFAPRASSWSMCLLRPCGPHSNSPRWHPPFLVCEQRWEPALARTAVMPLYPSVARANHPRLIGNRAPCTYCMDLCAMVWCPVLVLLQAQPMHISPICARNADAIACTERAASASTAPARAHGTLRCTQHTTARRSTLSARVAANPANLFGE